MDGKCQRCRCIGRQEIQRAVAFGEGEGRRGGGGG